MKKAVVAIGVGLAMLAVVIMVHHLAKHGYLVDEHDMKSHEFLAGVFASLGAGFLAGGLLQA